MESLAYTIFHIYADQLPWSHLSHEESSQMSDFKQVWHITHSLQGDCEYPLGHLIESSRNLQYDEEPDYDHWRRAFWEVDNGTIALPSSDPMYDPEDETEELPRNIDFIREEPPVAEYDILVVTRHMAKRIVRAGEQPWLPARVLELGRCAHDAAARHDARRERRDSGVRGVHHGGPDHVGRAPGAELPSGGDEGVG